MVSWTTGVRVRLSIMMFLQYAMYGIWIIPMGAYLGTLNFTGVQVGLAYGTSAIACMIAPFFIGMIADRFFSAQKMLGVMNLVGVVTLYIASTLKEPGAFIWVLLAHCLAYMPTWALTNTIAMAQMDDPAKEFPRIRVMGTLGWIVVSTLSLVFSLTGVLYETTTLPMMIGMGIGVCAAIFAFFLPDTPPKPTAEKITIGDILGLKALRLLKQPNFAVFVVCSFLIMLPGAFYWGFCNVAMNELGMKAVAFNQSFGQMSELVLMFFMPFFLVRLGVKKMLLVGMAAWIARFACFGYGNVGPLVAMFYMGFIFHGICFDFFFVTGQIYTDKKAPKEVQASAQGLISLVTFGAGMFLGNLLSGFVVQHYSTLDVRAADLLDRPALCAALAGAGSGAEASPARHIWGMLDADAQKAVAEAARDTADNPQRDDAIAKALDAAVASKGFYEKDAFAKLDVPKEAARLKELLGKADAGELEDPEPHELNRLLLEQVFTTKDAKLIAARRHDWQKVWLIPMAMAAVIMVLFALAFRDDSRAPRPAAGGA